MLMKFLPSISPAMFAYVDNAISGTGLLKMGTVTVPFDMIVKRNSDIYKLVNTDAGVKKDNEVLKSADIRREA